MNCYPRLRENFKNKPFTRKLNSHLLLNSFDFAWGVTEIKEIGDISRAMGDCLGVILKLYHGGSEHS